MREPTDVSVFVVSLAWTPNPGQSKMVEHVGVRALSGARVVEQMDIPCLGLQWDAGAAAEEARAK